MIRPKPDADEGVSGMLLRHGDTFGIVYATHLGNEGFERFSIGHELGHYFLDGHIDHVLPLGTVTHASHAGFSSTDQYEREADHFSAGLLMPSNLCRKILYQFEPGLDAIEGLAAHCRTSLTAAAIRFAELTDDAVGIIMSTDNTIDFCFLSDTMKAQPQITCFAKGFLSHAIRPRMRSICDQRLFASPHAPMQTATFSIGSAATDHWMPRKRSRGLGRYLKTLTVLSVPSLLDETFQDEDEDEDADLEESWTPQFRR